MRFCFCPAVCLTVLFTHFAIAVDPISTRIEPPRFEIANGRVAVWYEAEQGRWGIRAADGSAQLAGSVAGVVLGDMRVQTSSPCRRSPRRIEGSDALGRLVRLEVVHEGLAQVPELVWSATLRPGMPYAVIGLSARLAPELSKPLATLEILGARGPGAVRFGADPGAWMCFRDSGGQGGTGVVPFLDRDRGSQSSPATLLVHDRRAGKSLLLGWLSWVNSNPSLRLIGQKAGGLLEVGAACSYCLGRAPTQMAAEPLLIGFEPDPLLALEQYAKEVWATNKPPIRKDTVLGWLSWYCSRLKMTEQFVIDNAQVVADRFRAYGVDTMQVDHGWEHRDIVGHWVENRRFPHGMKWLGEELQKRGVKLGIWMAAACVSEYAPFYQEHPDALIHKADGTIWPYVERWTWAPHGRVFCLDPTHPAAQEHYRKSLGGLMEAGCRYYKVDFIGSSSRPAGVFHDPDRPRGYPMARYEMQQIRQAIGPDSWLRYCSSPSNVYCGIVNIGGATMDIGNASGNWEHLAKYHQQLGSCWYKHRTFWHNEPDALIVGEGPDGEARLRCAWLVLSGGVVALGDNLPKVSPERMALIPKCLPPYDVAARPLDLLQRAPSRIWDLQVRRPWEDYHMVGLFNLDPQEQSIAIPLARLGFKPEEVLAWEFWTEREVKPESGQLVVKVPARDGRVVALRRRLDRPQLLGTDMHLTMGGVELAGVKWDPQARVLSGTARRAPGASGRVFLHVPRPWRVVSGATSTGELATLGLHFSGHDAAWAVEFK